MITLHMFIDGKGYDLVKPDSGTIKWSEVGDESLQVTTRSKSNLYLSQPLGTEIIAVMGGQVIWRGRTDNVLVEGQATTITALGDIYALEDQEDYSAFWSQVGTNGWKQVSEAEITRGLSYDQLTYPVTTVSGIINDAFKIDFNNRVYISYGNNASIANGQSATVVFEIPYDVEGENLPTFLQCYLRVRLPNGFTLRIRGGGNTGSVPHNVANVGGNGALQLFGIFQENQNSSRKYFVQVVNDTGGTYTNTQPDGFWFAELRHVRFMSTSVNNLSTTLVGNTLAGSGIAFTVANPTGIYPGALVTFTDGNTETLQVLTVSGSVFTADAERTHANGNTLRISRLLASTVVSGICSTVLDSTTPRFIETTAQDIPNTSFNNTTPRKAIDSLLNDEYFYDMRGGLFQFYSRASNATPYYLDQAEVSFVKSAEQLTTHARVDYTSFVGFGRTTPYVTVPNTQLLERRRRFDAQVNNLALATGIANSILARQANNVIRAIPKGGTLYNTQNGRVSFPVTNTPIVLRNIIPEIYQLGDAQYYLRQVIYDFETAEFEYVIEEPEDTFERLLAGK